MALTPTERKRVEGAVETLARYNKSPFITDFLKQQPKPRIPGKYDKPELCELIKKVLLGEYDGRKKYVLKLEDLIAHLDRLQETGRQHIFLFSLPEKGRDEVLARLRDPEEVKALLRDEKAVYGAGRVVWESKGGPRLALARHDPPDGNEPPRSLLLKWVETRTFWAPQKPAGSAESEEASEEEELLDADEMEQVAEAAGTETGGEGREVQLRTGRDQKAQFWERREERAVSFFVINLDDGGCELRIQIARGQARATRQKLLATYRTLIADLFGFEPVGPTVLAPAIRQALIAREVPIVRCETILPTGGRFSGAKGELPPVDIRKLQAGLAIRFDWPQPGDGIGRVELDGSLDDVATLRPFLPEQHRLMLERVRRWREEGLALFSAPGTGAVITTAATDGGPQEGGESQPPSLPPPAPPPPLATILKVAIVGGVRPDPPAVQPGIDRATREYVRTHPAETVGAAPASGEAEGGTTSPVPPSVTADERMLERFLDYIKEVAQSEQATYQRELELVRGDEWWILRLFIISAVLALTITATGAGLIFFVVDAKLTVGTITALLGVLTGRGTVLIRSYAKNLKTKREMIQDQQRDSRRTLLMIQTALSIPDPQERTRAMANVAVSLLARVAGVAPTDA